jgi:protein subunit release factor B
VCFPSISLYFSLSLSSRTAQPAEQLTVAHETCSGPGGQKINKTNSAVQLKHLPTGVVVKSQATRSREQNRKIARGLLAEKLEEIEKGGESRKSVKRERESKKKKSAQKKKRRKYRALEAGKGGVLLEGEENGEGEQDGKGEEEEEWVVESEEERRVRVEGRDEGRGRGRGLVKNEAMEGEMLEGGVHIKR